jgi:hypothetical protein
MGAVSVFQIVVKVFLNAVMIAVNVCVIVLEGFAQVFNNFLALLFLFALSSVCS